MKYEDFFSFFKNKQIPIFHLASMARSGETLLLKCLDAHKNIHVVHNIQKEDSEDKRKLFNDFKKYKYNTIRVLDPLVSKLNLKDKKILFIKQGVWEHKYDFKGFILSRNPVSIYASLKNFEDGWEGNEKRIVRFMKGFNSPIKKKDLIAMSPLDQFCELYNHRMSQLIKLPLPIIYYEDFVKNPEDNLKKISKILNVKYSDKMLNSHDKFDKNFIGHGKNYLDRKIDDKSIYKFQNSVTLEEFNTICKKTRNIYSKYGYNIEWDNIAINKLQN